VLAVCNARRQAFAFTMCAMVRIFFAPDFFEITTDS
jgi:hypothetical protein